MPTCRRSLGRLWISLFVLTVALMPLHAVGAWGHDSHGPTPAMSEIHQQPTLADESVDAHGSSHSAVGHACCAIVFFPVFHPAEAAQGTPEAGVPDLIRRSLSPDLRPPISLRS